MYDKQVASVRELQDIAKLELAQRPVPLQFLQPCGCVLEGIDTVDSPNCCSLLFRNFDPDVVRYVVLSVAFARCHCAY